MFAEPLPICSVSLQLRAPLAAPSSAHPISIKAHRAFPEVQFRGLQVKLGVSMVVTSQCLQSQQMVPAYNDFEDGQQ